MKFITNLPILNIITAGFLPAVNFLNSNLVKVKKDNFDFLLFLYLEKSSVFIFFNIIFLLFIANNKLFCLLYLIKMG